MADNGQLADIAAVTRPYGYGGDGFGFGGSGIWLFAILALMFGGNGFGGWGNAGFANAIGYNNLATQNDVQRGFDTLSLENQSRDILGAVSAGTAQAVAATNQAKYDNINVAKDIQMALSSQISDVRAAQAQALANQNECCCNTLRAIDGINYNAAMNTAAINANITAGVNSIKDQLKDNEITSLRTQLADVRQQLSMYGVVRYPNGMVYNAGQSPFCNCGCGQFA